MAVAMEREQITTLESDQLVGLATGIKSEQIVEIGNDRLFAMVDKIDKGDVESLGEGHLSSMMSGIQGGEIGKLDKSKKVSIVKNLKANFFGQEQSNFKEIQGASSATSRPTVSDELLGKTKLSSDNSKQKVSNAFGRLKFE
jgi:hypothetical protein